MVRTRDWTSSRSRNALEELHEKLAVNATARLMRLLDEFDAFVVELFSFFVRT
jgi:hypothetical protein